MNWVGQPGREPLRSGEPADGGAGRTDCPFPLSSGAIRFGLGMSREIIPIHPKGIHMKAALIADASGNVQGVPSAASDGKDDFLDKAAVASSPKGEFRLKVAEVPDPVAGPEDLLVRIEHISIEGGDLMFRQLGMAGPTGVLGYCAAGEIIGMGDKVTGFEIGQKVSTFAATGSHATLRVAPAATCFVVPNGLDLGAAATIPVVGGTAGRAMELANVGKGDVVLVLGAAGGLGIMAVQLAARRGARVIGTGTTAASLEKTRDYGVSDIIVVSEDRPASAQVRELLGGNKVDVLFDTIGGPAMADAFDLMAEKGRVVMLGGFGGLDEKIHAGQLLLRELMVTGCLFGAQMGEPANYAMVSDLLKLTAKGELRVPVDRTFPFDEIDAAHARAEERGRFGRIFVTV
jgi:NADPH:quinone reductase